MSTKLSIFKKNIKHKFLILGGLVCLIVLLPLFSFPLYFYNRIYPGVYLSNIYVGSLVLEDATTKINDAILLPEHLTLVYRRDMDPQVFKIPVEYIELTYDIEDGIRNAYNFGRDKKPIKNISALGEAIGQGVNLPITVYFNEEKLDEHLQVIAGQTSTDAVYPSIKISGKNVLVDRGKPGIEVDRDELKQTIYNNLSQLNYSPIDIKTKLVNPALSENQAKILEDRAYGLLSKTLMMKYKEINFSIKGDELVSFISHEIGGYDQTAIEKKVDSIVPQVETQPQNPTLIFEEGRVKEFTPAKNGIQIKREDLTSSLLAALVELETTPVEEIEVNIPVIETPPSISTGEVNNLGIQEIIGKGTSRFRGSIASRVHNVALAASRINGVVIPPGEEFSFNKALGDISKFTGYKEAYIIQDGKTVLGDGGGVCQVSTTLFRAVLNAGLPISERRGHSYRVGYYEQDSSPGLDATVFSPTTDFKFRNDTGAHILIQALTDTKNMTLAFELYGTSDGRVSTVSKPIIASSTPPPPDVYVDDPNLPAGTTKQIEYQAWGAKVTFSYEVTRNGESIYSKNFVTNYKPWQAVYLRGTKPL